MANKTRETARKRATKRRVTRSQSLKRGQVRRQSRDGDEDAADDRDHSDEATISPEEYADKRTVPPREAEEPAVTTRSQARKEWEEAERFLATVAASEDKQPTFRSGRELISAVLGELPTQPADPQSRVVRPDVDTGTLRPDIVNEEAGYGDDEPAREDEPLVAERECAAEAPERQPTEAETMAAALQELREEVRQLRLRRDERGLRYELRRAAEGEDRNQQAQQLLQQNVRRDNDGGDRQPNPRRSQERRRREGSRDRRGTPPRRQPGRRRQGSPGGDDPSSSSSSENDSDGHDAGRRYRRRSSSEDSSSGESDEHERVRRRERHEQRGPRRRQRNQRRSPRRERRRAHHEVRGRRRGNVKDLELPTFTPTTGATVSTWTDRIDLALQGAKESGRGEWSDHALYFILGNKLMGEAASWWVDFNRRLTDNQRTWTHLKQALLRRYGQKEDISLAEYRVNTRSRGAKESHADYAAALRKAAGRSRVSERVLMAQFYRGMDKTTRQLVKQQEPENLEEAVIKATEIDDPMENLAQLVPVGQTTTATTTGASVTDGVTVRSVTLPGVGSVYVPASGTAEGIKNYAAVDPDGLVLYTNPKGAWNIITGTYELPAGRKWNSRYWAEPSAQKRSKSRRTDHRRTERKQRARRDVDSSDDDEREAQSSKVTKPRRTADTSEDEYEPKPRKKTKPKRAVNSSNDEREEKPQKKLKAAVRQVLAEESKKQRAPTQSPNRGTNCRICGQSGHWAAYCTLGPKCYACNQRGHMARECPDAEAKAKNDEYMAKRNEKIKPAENEKGTS